MNSSSKAKAKGKKVDGRTGPKRPQNEQLSTDPLLNPQGTPVRRNQKGHIISQSVGLTIDPRTVTCKYPDFVRALLDDKEKFPNRQEYLQIALHRQLRKDGLLSKEMIEALEKAGRI